MKRLPLWICFAGILSLFYCPSSARSHDWFSWRGPEQTGVSREKNLPSEWSPDPKNPTNFIWKAPYGCRSTPIVMNGRVYLNNQVGEKIHEQERVMCLDEKTGKLIWEKRFNVFLTDIVSVRLGWASLAGDPKTGNIYWHGTQGHFVCFDKDGKILWQRSLTEEYGRITGYGGRVNTPVVDEDLVIIGMMNFSWGPHGKGANRHLAMNKHTGEVVWWSESPHKPKNTYYSTPVIAVVNKQRLMITGGGEGYLHAIKVRTGEPVWNVKIVKGGVNPSPVMDGNLVYICHGAENVDSNEKGGIFCFDAGKVEDGKPKLVWKQYGISANYCSPLIKDGRLYICSDIARMYCLDSKTGKLLWRRPLAYGRNAKGSPVWADDKIYVCPVNGSFSIIQPGSSRGKIIHEHFFPPEGIVPAETNGTPAVANGRVFVCTRDETYCIGKKEIVKAAPLPEPPKQPAPGKPAAVRILPADVVVHPGDKVQFTVQLLDKYGYVVGKLKKDAAQKWSLPVPPSPPKAKAPLPALKGEISANGELLVDGKALSQEGLVKLETGMGSSTARIRVAPRFPYKIDFNDLPKGAAPGGWVNAQNKFFVTELDGE